MAHRIAAALPDARLAEIAGGHVPYVEHRDTLAREISAFAPELDHRPAGTR